MSISKRRKIDLVKNALDTDTLESMNEKEILEYYELNEPNLLLDLCCEGRKK